MMRVCPFVIIIYIEWTPNTAHEPKAMPETSDDSNLAADSDVWSDNKDMCARGRSFISKYRETVRTQIDVWLIRIIFW